MHDEDVIAPLPFTITCMHGSFKPNARYIKFTSCSSLQMDCLREEFHVLKLQIHYGSTSKLKQSVEVGSKWYIFASLPLLGVSQHPAIHIQ